MKHTMKLFQIGVKQIVNDGMLLVLIPAPFLIGVFFKFAIPWMNTMLTARFSFSITAWYGLVDGMLLCLTPMFVAMISSFLLLEETEDGLNAFYQITPAEGYSYLLARVGLPMLWAFFITLIVCAAFNLSSLSFQVILSGSLISSLTGISFTMMVVSIASNRVEGLALAKLMGISFMGLILLWFLPPPYCYLLSFLPSFWVGKLLMDGAAPVSFFLGLLSCLLWIAFFIGKFRKKIS